MPPIQKNQQAHSEAGEALADSVPAHAAADAGPVLTPGGNCHSRQHKGKHQPIWDATAAHIRKGSQ